ncbi:unnamed protein product, partial [marine sediment metagenome]
SVILVHQRYNADKAQSVLTVINKAVVLIGGYKDNAIFRYLSFSLLAHHYPPTGKNEHLVFPRVLMRWGRATRLNIKDTHTEIWCSLIGTDNLALN